MKLVLEFLPILVFFGVYLWQGLIWATAATMLSSLVLLGYRYHTEKKWDKVLLISTLLLLTMGGITLITKNPLFIQYKLSVFYAALSLFLVVSAGFFHKNWVAWLFRQALPIGEHTGRVLLIGTLIFFMMLAGINVVLILWLSFDQWLWIKTWGSLVALLLFAFWQGVVVMRDPAVAESIQQEKKE